MIANGENPYLITGKSRQDACDALREIENWRRSADTADLVKALSELYLLSARAPEGEDRKAVIALYAKRLQDYPGDVALDAVRNYRGNFFPAYDELRKLIEADRRIAERKARGDALREFLRDDEEKPFSGNRPTAEHIKRNWEAFSGPEAEQQFSRETLGRLAEVDRVHGDRAKVPGGKWKSIGELAKGNLG